MGDLDRTAFCKGEQTEVTRVGDWDRDAPLIYFSGMLTKQVAEGELKQMAGCGVLQEKDG